MQKSQKPLVVVMGVSGVGKTTLGRKLSEQLKIPFFDADDYHPPANKSKMASGLALTDEDRNDWLHQLSSLLEEHQQGCVLACSALKESYRQILSGTIGHQIHWIFLYGTFRLLFQRLQKRKGHFMPESLLQSQFDTLEKPLYGLHLNVRNSIDKLLDASQNYLKQSAFGLVGMGVMGTSLARNLASKGITISLYNRRVKGKEEKIAQKARAQYTELKTAKAFENLTAFVNSLQRPRKIFLMIPAGKALDLFIKHLLPLLDYGDVVIDGGNSHYEATGRHIEDCRKKGIYFLGVGVSGGEKGALQGPAIMPGGDPTAYQLVAPYLCVTAAKDVNGQPCIGYIGSGGSGHFVKMVHNGIEYAEMQLIAEWIQFLSYAGWSYPAISRLFEKWQNSDADSYLLGITLQILNTKENRQYVIDDILDTAGNKGTGNWTTVAASRLGEPATVLTAALFARYTSALKNQREAAAGHFDWCSIKNVAKEIPDDGWLSAYQAARWVIYHQGLELLKTASAEFGWGLNLAEICRIWTQGCIIRSALMEKLKTFSFQQPLLLTPAVIEEVKTSVPNLKNWVQANTDACLPIPCSSAAMQFVWAYTQENASANILQAQRDFFGAHGFQRKSDPDKKSVHFPWEADKKLTDSNNN